MLRLQGQLFTYLSALIIDSLTLGPKKAINRWPFKFYKNHISLLKVVQRELRNRAPADRVQDLILHFPHLPLAIAQV